MRNIFFILCFAAAALSGFTDFSTSSQSLPFSSSRPYWYCNQLGKVKGRTTLALTSSFTTEREFSVDDFESAASSQIKNFDPVFSGVCLNFESNNDAGKEIRKQVDMSKKTLVSVVFVKFP